MRTSLDIEDELSERLGRLAENRKRPADVMIGDAIRQYIEREEARESFVQEAEASWTDYQENGLHLTGKEVQDWLQSWGTDQKKGPPECHK
ncbi:putative transcriptional regulator [Neorhizobium huautlense]|uniref:Transcriptional regulator n=1 Tax=Neorhizobium huautlense TaxID=67774 RepID=A0ABT9PUG1_9HYPH|nr:CopG family transcriptional regulator [Neorhizobium huautlense]MDP9838110.1 putative transcriptional regulator [Neorhizobium huautlense]